MQLRVFGAEVEVGLGEHPGETQSDRGSFHTNCLRSRKQVEMRASSNDKEVARSWSSVVFPIIHTSSRPILFLLPSTLRSP